MQSRFHWGQAFGYHVTLSTFAPGLACTVMLTEFAEFCFRNAGSECTDSGQLLTGSVSLLACLPLCFGFAMSRHLTVTQCVALARTR